MNIMNRVTWTTMKKNRTRTIVTMIGIILSATMFTAVTTFCSSMYSYLRESAIYQSGSYHAGAENLTGEKLASVMEDERLKSAYFAEIIGYANIGSINDYKPYIYVEATDDEFFANMPVHVISGRLPENGGELLLPEHLNSNGGVAIEIGSQLTLEIGSRCSDGAILTQSNPFVPEVQEEITDTTERTYTIVGYYERPRFEGYTAPGYTALTLRDGDIDPSAVYNGYFTVNKPRTNYEAFIDENGLIESGVLTTNTTVLMFDGYTLYSNWTNMLYSVAAIFCVLIFIGSVSLIYSAFSISVNERTKQFGLLSSIGATRKQIRRSVLIEAFSLSIVGIPIGLAVGIAGMGTTLYFCRGLFKNLADAPLEMHIKLSFAAIIIAIAITLFTVLISVWIPSKRAMRVTPIEAIRQARDVRAKGRDVRYSKLFYKFFGAEGVLAKKYYARSRRRYRATIVSLAMSVMLFISASSFCMYLTKTVEVGADASNYDIVMPLPMYDFSRISGALEAEDSVKEVSYMLNTDRRYAYLPNSSLTKEYIDAVEKHHVTDPLMLPLHGLFVYYIDDGYYTRLLKENGLDPSAYMSGPDTPPLVYNHCEFKDYQNDGTAGHTMVEYTYDVLKNNMESIMLALPHPEAPEGTKYYDIMISESGEPMYYYVPLDDEYEADEKGRPVGQPTAQVEYTELKLGAFIDELPLGMRQRQSMQLVFPISMLSEAETEALDEGMLYISSSTEDTDATVDALKSALNDSGVIYSSGSIYDQTDDVRMMRNIVTLVEVFSYGFIVLISLISIANVFNTISTNVALRRRDYAMLRSIGMTHRGMNRMTNFECILYGTRSLFIGLPLAIAFTYLIYRVVVDVMDVPFNLPWTAVALAVSCVFIVVFASMLYAVGRIKRDNPIDALKDENV